MDPRRSLRITAPHVAGAMALLLALAGCTGGGAATAGSSAEPTRSVAPSAAPSPSPAPASPSPRPSATPRPAETPRPAPSPLATGAATGPCDERLDPIVDHIVDRLDKLVAIRASLDHSDQDTGMFALMMIGDGFGLEQKWIAAHVPSDVTAWPSIAAYERWLTPIAKTWDEIFYGTGNDADLAKALAELDDVPAIEKALKAEQAGC